MTNIDRAAQVILQSTACTATEVTQALADATPPLLMPDPQIIRTVEELRELDPDTVLSCGWQECHYLLAKDLHPDHLPAVVITPADQVRAAHKALEKETNND